MNRRAEDLQGTMLLRHSGIYGISRVVPGIINFATIALFTRLLAPEEYGQYALVVAGVGLANVVLFQWLRVSVLRFLPTQQDSRHLLSSVLNIFLLLIGATGILGATIVALWPDPEWQRLIGFAIPLLWVYAWHELNLEMVRSQLRPVQYGVMVTTKSVVALGLGVLLIIIGLGPAGPILALTLGLAIAGFLFARTNWKSITPRISPALIHQMLQYGAPLTATFALAAIVSSSDRFMIAWLLGEGAAGQYSAPYDLAYQSVTLLMITVNLAAYPIIVRAFSNGGERAAEGPLRQNMTGLIGIGLPAAVGIAILANNIAHVLFGEAFQVDGGRLLPWIAAASFVAGIRAYGFDLSFQLGKKTALQVLSVGAAAVANIALNLTFIPIFGVVGAAYATLASYLVALVVSMWLSRLSLTIPVPQHDAARIAAATLAMTVVLFYLRSHGGVGWLIVQTSVGGSIYAAAAYILDVGHMRTALSGAAPWSKS